MPPQRGPLCGLLQTTFWVPRLWGLSSLHPHPEPLPHRQREKLRLREPVLLKVTKAEEEHLCAGVNILDFSAVTAGTRRSQHIHPSYRDAIPSLIHLQHRGLELADEVVASITVIVIAHNLGQVQHGHPRAVPGCALSLLPPEQTSCLSCGHSLLPSGLSGIPELPPTGNFLGLLEKQVEVPQG